jgi:hypothetical protein
MEQSSKLIVGGCFGIFFGLSIPAELAIAIILTGILCVVDGIYRKKGYHNKTFYLICFSIIVLFGSFIFYILLFKSYIIEFSFYISIGIFILITTGYIIEYHCRIRSSVVPWKNEW